MNPLMIVAVTLIVTLVAVAVIVSGFMIVKKTKEFYSLLRNLEINLGLLAGAVKGGALDFAALPKLIEGLTAVTREEVAQLAEIEKVVGTLSGALFAPNSRDYIEQAEKNTELANRAYEIQQLRRNGIPQAEAEARVDERELWKRMNVTPGMPVMTGEE